MEMFRGELWVGLLRVFPVKVIPALDGVGPNPSAERGIRDSLDAQFSGCLQEIGLV
jgi:hypothetical protein